MKYIVMCRDFTKEQYSTIIYEEYKDIKQARRIIKMLNKIEKDNAPRYTNGRIKPSLTKKYWYISHKL